MEDLLQALCKLDFTKTEADIYITLVKHKQLSGYKIAKLINLSRSSVYKALDNLYQKGHIYLLPKEANEYVAKRPEILMEELKSDYVATADILKEKLSQFDEKPSERSFFNIEGYDNIITKTKELLLEAKTEIYMNTTIDLQLFKSEIEMIHARGVRIIVFSFSALNHENLPIELYSSAETEHVCHSSRLMLVVDYTKTLIASNMRHSDYIGTFTENHLLSSIVSEHIHHDIYLHKLKNKYEKSLLDKDILLCTLMEEYKDHDIPL